MDPEEERIKRMEEDLKRREELERKRVESEQRRQQELSQMQTQTSENVQGPKKEFPTTILWIVLVLVIVGLLLYKYGDDIWTQIKELGKKIEKMIPGNFASFLNCIWLTIIGQAPPEQCWGVNEPPEQLTKNKIIDFSINPNNPFTGEKYELDVEIMNFHEDIDIKDIKIIGGLVCTEDDDNTTTVILTKIDSKPINLDGGEKKVVTLRSEDIIDYKLESCEKVSINVTYGYHSTLKTHFIFGKTRDIAREKSLEVRKNDKLSDGPIDINVLFIQNDYYYIGKDDMNGFTLKSYGINAYIFKPMFWILLFGIIPSILTGRWLGKKIKSKILANSKDQSL